MITLSELQMKEVVMMDGKRLGFIDDLEINEDSGFIQSLIVIDRGGKGTFFQKPEEKKIKWSQIITIGTDIILVHNLENSEKIKESSSK